ncbi:ATP-dependent helicase [Clostridium sp. DL1XJH146]
MQKINLIDEYYSERDKLIENRYKNLNEKQIKAVLSSNLNSCIIACPGSGKTTTLLNRVDYLVNFGQIYKTNLKPSNLDNIILDIMKQYNQNNTLEKKVKTNNIEENRIIELINNYKISPGNIIVITFTKAAAMNMKKRFIKSNKKEVTPFFGTFHALFYKILQREIGRVNIIQSYESYNIIKGILSQVKEETNDEEIRTIINDISSYKKSSLDMEMYKTHISKDVFIKCFEAYEEYKKKKSLLDFEDLQINVRDLFLNNKNILMKYRRVFRYILVDEFQDCDDIQVEILRLLSSENNYIFAVGDEDQCIYGFRGSKPEYMVNFDGLFFNSNKYFLTINYRCPQTVINSANFLIKNNIKRNNKRMDWYKNNSNGNDIQVFSGINENSEADYICKEIQKKVSNGEYNYKDYAILYRTNQL